MYATSTTHHLNAADRISVDEAGIISIRDTESGAHYLNLVLGSHEPATARAAFLRKLAEAASDLADEIVLRDLEAAS